MLRFPILLILCCFQPKVSHGARGKSRGGDSGNSSGEGSGSGGRESLDFILPDPDDELGNKCLQFSRYFCLLRYWVPEKQSTRALSETDRLEFRKLIETDFAKFNFFSFQPEDRINGGCCGQQLKIYRQNGQRNGLSPQQYFEKITNFGDVNRKIVYIKARYDAKLCSNIISQIGFGRGALRIVGGRPVQNFVVISHEEGGVFWIPRSNMEIASFDWFKDKIICKDQPRFCETGTSANAKTLVWDLNKEELSLRPT